MAQLMHLSLARDVARDATRILNVLLAIEHVPNGFGFRPDRIPHMHCENQRVATRIVLKNCLGWRIGENPPSQ